jgi:hypothetical protein
MNLEPILYWVKEREAVRLKKEAGEPPPWTDDPILQKFRFTNVRRRDDRVSRWLYNVLLSKIVTATAHSLMLTALCRWINWPPTVHDLLHGPMNKSPLDLPAIGRWLDERQKNRIQTWTGAYMIPPPKPKGTMKGSYVAVNSIGSMERIMPELLALIKTGCRRDVHALLMGLPLWGSFISGQIVDDWTWTPILSGATDLYTWAPIGPGSRTGLNLLMGNDPNHRFKDAEWCERLQELREAIAALGPAYVNVTAMDAQNCLCEYSKYARAKMGGRPGKKTVGLTVYRPEERF